MSEKYGIENVKTLLLALAELGNVIEDMKESEGSFFSKLKALSKLWDDVAELIKLKWKDIPLEFGDFSAEEKLELNNAFAEKFDLSNDDAEVRVERGLFIITNYYAPAVVETLKYFGGLKEPVSVAKSSGKKSAKKSGVA